MTEPVELQSPVHAGGPPLTRIVNRLVSLSPWVSVTVMRKLKLVVVAVGVPERTPSALTLRPGKVSPVLLQVYGAVPPMAANGK